MKIRNILIGGVFACSSLIGGAAFAQDSGDAAKWSITLTPRYQKLFFLIDTEADGLETMDTFGGSVAVRDPSGRFGFMATHLRGKANGVYTYDDNTFQGDYAYRAKRREYALQFDYTPNEANVSFIAGYHRFTASSRENLLTALPGNSEANDYHNSINAAEIGLRLSSRLGANSRQSVSAQFTGGIGRGRYRANEREVFSGTTTNTVTNEKGTGYIGDIALGYNIFVTDAISVGARGRGYVFYVDTPGSDPLFALTPELNFSIRF